MKLAYPVGTPDIKDPFMGFQGDFAASLSDIGSAGYTAVELFVCNPENIDIDTVRSNLNKHNIKVAAVGTTHVLKQDGLFLMSMDQEIRKKAVIRAKLIIDLASAFSAPVAIGKFRGSAGTEKNCRTVALDILRDEVQVICQHAADKGINILLEPQNSSNIDNINTVDEALNFIYLTDSPNLLLHIDTMHIDITEKSPPLSILRAGSKIGFIHCSDTARKIPGLGTIDLKGVFSSLKSIGYKGFVSMEIEQIPDCRTAAVLSFRFMNKLLEGLN